MLLVTNKIIHRLAPLHLFVHPNFIRYTLKCLRLCLSTCLPYQLFITFPPEKQRLSLAKTLTHQIFVSFYYCVVVPCLEKRSR